MLMYSRGNKKSNIKNGNINNTVDNIADNIDISSGKIVEFSDPPSVVEPVPHVKATGKILQKANNILTASFCIKKREGMPYTTSSSVFMQYTELKENYMFYADIKSIRPLNENDNFTVSEMTLLDEEESSYDVYVLNIVPTSCVLKFQRRQYYRSILGVNIYYLPIGEEEAKNNDTKIRFITQNRFKEKLKAEQGHYEDELGYKKLKTLDISGGGFKFLSDDYFEVYTNFDCLMILGNEAIPAVAQVLACSMSQDFTGKYNVRCCYFEISEIIRDRIMKFIFEQERQIQRKYANSAKF